MYIRGEWALRKVALNQVSGVPGWGAKGDFMRYSYLYPYIFESRTHTFFESTCPEHIRTAKLGMIRCLFVEK